jgi:hypothetical protein
MGIFDILLMGLIAGGAGYYLYRSLWKKKGCSCSNQYSMGCSKGGTRIDNTLKNKGEV